VNIYSSKEGCSAKYKGLHVIGYQVSGVNRDWYEAKGDQMYEERMNDRQLVGRTTPIEVVYLVQFPMALNVQQAHRM